VKKMKKIFIVVTVMVVTLIALGTVGFAYAQAQTPTAPANPNTPGGTPRGGQPGAYGQGGMMNGFRGQAVDGEFGPMHDAMIEAFASALGLMPDELQGRIDAGETLWSIAQAQGVSADQFQSVFLQARNQVLNKAVADGTITQGQADFMLNRMNQMWQNGFGPGSMNCDGSAARVQQRIGRGMGGRWANPSNP
jgi:hypothetical protein